MSTSINPAKVRSIRLERGLTQQDLAEKAQLSVRTLQRMECGGRAHAGTVMRIAEALQVSLDELRERAPLLSPGRRPVGGHVVLIASTKGGTGRTTLAISLAGLLEELGHRVCLLDFSHLRGVSSYMAWAQMLRQPVPSHVLARGPAEAASRLAGLRQGFDCVVIDSSAHEDADLIPLALKADQILLTTEHPRVDLGIAHRVKMWLHAATLVDGTISIVQTRASRYESHRRADLAFLQQIGLPLCETVLHARAAYTYAFVRGKTVTVDDPNGLAAAELRELCHELGWVNDRPWRAVRDRRRTTDDLAYFQAFMNMSHLPTVLARGPSRWRAE